MLKVMLLKVKLLVIMLLIENQFLVAMEFSAAVELLVVVLAAI